MSFAEAFHLLLRPRATSSLIMVTGSPSGGVDKDKILGPELEGEIKAICRDLLERCGAEYKIVPFSNFDLWDACWTHVQNEYHIHRDDTTGAFPKLHKYIRLGVLMADTSYAHILDLKLRVWIALFTALTTYLDDVVSSDNHHLRTFTGVLLLGRSHDHPVLNAFISFLKDMPDKFDDFIVNMVVSASMRYLMSIALEVEGKSDQISPHGRKYPGYVRSLSGMPDAYGVFAFPLHLPRSTYIQALPEVMEFVYAIKLVAAIFSVGSKYSWWLLLQ
ncbi:hypothetical protein FA15DRAFT_270896 [Coprinopsis marcescibilis]|uniref:Uncharacterized protein n=1 Tax=Coprinopsis marcescibilis TaxID=230819 RepID=A0A5C3L1H9_COPMA|nr:hypothetical protein FA15DRAFT_270896 [Coprinopsis marcescibilis]